VDEVTSSRVNSDGSLASFIAKTQGEVDPAIWVWDAGANAVHTFDLSVTGRVPLAHHWSATEPTLLAIEAGEPDSDSATGAVANEVVTMFVTAEDGIIVQHRISLGPADGQLIGIQIPFVLHVDRALVQMSEGAKAVDKRVLPSFVGLEGATADVKTAMLAFSYNLAINNMDEAFKAVRAIKNEKVWESMARMCVESRRMDVASVCVGSMKNAVAARALRESAAEPEPEVQAACLAAHLGMFETAEDLYKECGRYDLLNRFYQDSGKWEEALEVAKRHDRPHLRATQYNYGKFLEACGKTKEAERRFEASLTHHFEVPRMYTDDPDQLKEYIERSGSQELEKWWAQFLESSQDMSGALEYYGKAGDALSQARVHCYCGDMDRAKEIVDESGNAAAAYHLARQYENQEMVNEAIAYYEKSGCYSSAIRIARENGRRDEIGRLAMQSNKHDQIEAAQFFESQVGAAVVCAVRANHGPFGPCGGGGAAKLGVDTADNSR
jgi:intraflagellar transport protein 140